MAMQILRKTRLAVILDMFICLDKRMAETPPLSEAAR
jgi:hypothetical protein